MFRVFVLLLVGIQQFPVHGRLEPFGDSWVVLTIYSNRRVIVYDLFLDLKKVVRHLNNLYLRTAG